MALSASALRVQIERLKAANQGRLRKLPVTGAPAPEGYAAWLRTLFPGYFSAELADHHHEHWRWVDALTPGVRPIAQIEVWPRGGGKSTGAEVACVRVAARRARRYAWYISGTQPQADDHVGNVAALLESPSVERHYPALAARSVGKYGASKGWRRNRVRTTAGFTVDALGLDTASRGVKLDEARPDLMIFDDVDDAADSLETVQKKIVAITQKLLPAGASDLAILYLQNVVHHEGVMARLVGLASTPPDFLHDRHVVGPIPAVVGLQTEKQPDGRHRIVGGRATWAGQSLQTCERQINDWGIRAFLAEAQHDRTPPVGQAFPEFDPTIHVIEPFEIPEEWPRWRAIDYGYAAPFCCLWLSRDPSGTIVVYRELYGPGLTASQQATQICALSIGERYMTTVGDPSMWASAREGQRFQSVADQYAGHGVPLLPASNDRLAGAERIHFLLDWAEQKRPSLQVFRTCANLIRTMPLLVRDPNRPEDVDTDGEDHAYDALRYGAMAAHWLDRPREIRTSDVTLGAGFTPQERALERLRRMPDPVPVRPLPVRGRR